MTFTEWYKETQGDEWNSDYAGMYGYAMELIDKYEEWCTKNDFVPVWNG